MPRDVNEPVRLTKIYTRGGDAGQTSLGDGSRVSKLDPRIVAYGLVDELHSHLGVIRAAAYPPPGKSEGPCGATKKQAAALGRNCDELKEPLPELKSFVLPGGSEA